MIRRIICFLRGHDTNYYGDGRYSIVVTNTEMKFLCTRCGKTWVIPIPHFGVK